MPILSFDFRSKIFNWRLNKLHLQNFNLLVGLSGVGKSNILRCLQTIRVAGTHETGSFYANGSEWTIELETGGDHYEWSAKVSVSALSAFSSAYQNGVRNDFLPSEMPYFVREKLTKDGQEIVSRDEHGAISFAGSDYLRLRNTGSVLALLSNEPLVAPVFHFLNQIAFSESQNYGPDAQELVSQIELFPLQRAEEARAHFKEVGQLQNLRGVPLLLKAYILQENFPQVFERLKEKYFEIFDTVMDLKVSKFEELVPQALSENTKLSGYLVLGIKEKGIKDWILGHLISKGMLRTMIHLFELEMMPSDSVILVDEFEDGLGMNCLPSVTDIFLSNTDKQFILTSHHPYIINKIPMKYWKLVTRKGSEVTVIDANSVSGLDPNSLLSGFVQLTNLEEEYAEAIR